MVGLKQEECQGNLPEQIFFSQLPLEDLKDPGKQSGLIFPELGPGVGPAHGGGQEEPLKVWDKEKSSFPISETTKKIKT